MLADLIKKCRSYRRFYQDIDIKQDELLAMIDNARLSASGKNAQSLKYIISNTPEKNARIFPHLMWAGYLKDWPGPEEGERPAAYIIMLNDTEISTHYFCDHGIAAQSILLTATEQGFGGCIIASLNRDNLRDELSINKRFEVIQVIALGKPKETVVIDVMGSDGNYKYWRDANQVHHVPKRSLSDIITTL